MHRSHSLRSAATLAALVVLLSGVLQVNAQSATPVASPVVSPSAALPPAWLEFGPGGALTARILVQGACPSLALDGVASPMTSRAAPSEAFPVVACEAAIPFGVHSAAIGSQQLPLPQGPIHRIAVIGDTGCRLSDWDKRYQACNDPQAWPFAEVAQAVAAWKPDLIVHVGDYLYREAACPAGDTGCAGSPHGDNWATWNADFFAPVSPLLGVAPWVVMRGNHETCSRNPEGWFRYLDPRAYQAACQRFTEPYVMPVFGVTFAALDSAEASDTTITPDIVARYRQQFALLSEIAPSGAWLVTHRPYRGVLEGKRGAIEVDNASYKAATNGSLDGDYALILSGHIHLAETMAFAPDAGRPPQVISGNAGTALDDVPTGTPTPGQLDDASVTEAETLSSFGFITFEPRDGEWLATQRDVSGTAITTCTVTTPEIACEPAAAGS